MGGDRRLEGRNEHHGLELDAERFNRRRQREIRERRRENLNIIARIKILAGIRSAAGSEPQRVGSGTAAQSSNGFACARNPTGICAYQDSEVQTRDDFIIEMKDTKSLSS